ncbi:unnamed protein product [Gadus morhua 'NCC']
MQSFSLRRQLPCEAKEMRGEVKESLRESDPQQRPFGASGHSVGISSVLGLRPRRRALIRQGLREAPISPPPPTRSHTSSSCGLLPCPEQHPQMIRAAKS